MNILVTLDKNYIPVVRVMISSLLDKNPNTHFSVYLAYSDMDCFDFEKIIKDFDENRVILYPIKITDLQLNDAPVEKRYPKEMYYRIFAATFLPRELDRVLYLDPDIVCLNSINELYNMDLKENFFAAASHVNPPLQMFNNIRLSVPSSSRYCNSGVLLINLEALRKEQVIQDVFVYIKANKWRLMLPDQDVLNGLYHNKFITIDCLKYNLGDKCLMQRKNLSSNKKITLKWISENTVFVHYFGRNKPWNSNYTGKLGIFFENASQSISSVQNL